MTEGNIAAEPLSRARLRKYAARVRKALKLEECLYVPVCNLLEAMPIMFEKSGLTVEIVSVDELPHSQHGYFDPYNHRLVIREDVYDGAYVGNGRDRMTIMHEISHFLLISVSGIKVARRFEPIKTYENPEWQATVLAAEILMPATEVVDMKPEQISEACGVSMEAAEVQHRVLQRSKAD